MATFGETLRAALIADAAVAALVNARVFPSVIPQDATFPAVRYMVVDDLPWNTLEGGHSRRAARVQVDVYAPKYLGAHALADAVAGAVGSITGPAMTAVLLSRRDGYEDVTGKYRVSMDFSMSMEV